MPTCVLGISTYYLILHSFSTKFLCNRKKNVGDTKKFDFGLLASKQSDGNINPVLSDYRYMLFLYNAVFLLGPFYSIGKYLSLSVYNLLLCPSPVYIVFRFSCYSVSSYFPLFVQAHHCHASNNLKSFPDLPCFALNFVFYLIHSNLFIFLSNTYISLVLKYSSM